MPSSSKVNLNLVKLIQDLKALSREHNAPIWGTVAKKLERPSRNWAEVNVSRVARHAKDGESLVVPGTLLGSGSISIGVTVAAFRASSEARKKIESAGGKVTSIMELAESNPDGSNVRIMG